MVKSINPYDQSVVAEFELHDDKAIGKVLEQATKAYTTWRKETFSFRAEKMNAAAAILRKNKEQYARIITAEMGKAIQESRNEVEKCAGACEYFAQHAQEFLAGKTIATEAKRSYVQYDPIGAVFAIMPWNFPFWQVFRFAAPTLMAGNVGILKHASNVSKTSLTLESVFREAGFPEGVFQSLIIDTAKVEKIIGEEIIQAVTLTGSEQVGAKVAAIAGKNIKKSVMELGGSDAFIVLEDADLEQAAKVATTSRMQNAGQSCIAAKRFIVVDRVKAEFTALFKKNIEALRQGNPMDEKITTGPVARLDLAETIEKQLQESLKAGTHLITGGKRSGCNFAPTLIDNVRPGMIAFDEEIFGPVAALITAKDEQDAIALANQSQYGLGSSLWTRDLDRAARLAGDIEAGSVFVNSLMRSDSRLPFGGVKKSGYGRELAEAGIREFVNVKTVLME